jgi:hypothetical protein
MLLRTTSEANMYALASAASKMRLDALLDETPPTTTTTATATATKAAVVEATVVAKASPVPVVSVSVAQRLLVGVIAGCVTRPVVNPLSLIQTRMVTDNTGFLQTLGRIVKHDGVLTLWDSLQVSLILTCNPAIQYMCFDKLRQWLVAHLHRKRDARIATAASDGTANSSTQSDAEAEAEVQPTALQAFFMGFAATTVSTVLTYPLILAAVRLRWKDKSGTIRYKGTWDVLCKVVKFEGWMALYSGLGPQLTKSVLGAALMFAGKEKLEQLASSALGIRTPEQDDNDGDDAHKDAGGK